MKQKTTAYDKVFVSNQNLVTLHINSLKISWFNFFLPKLSKSWYIKVFWQPCILYDIDIVNVTYLVKTHEH